MMKKALAVLTFAGFLTAGAMQLFANPTPQQCYYIVSDCELFCYVEQSGDPYPCMLWCVPEECHPYI